MIQYTKKEIPFVVAKNIPYSQDLLINSLETLKIRREGSRVITYFDRKKICQTEVSDKYQIFDFAGFIYRLLERIDTFLTPSSFSLTIERGIQQLVIHEQEMMIAGEIFKKTLNIFSSSNKYYPVLVAGGLYRQVCSNGLMAPVRLGVDRNVRHFQKCLPELEQYCLENLPFLQQQFEEQVALVLSLKNNPISLQHFVAKISVQSIKQEEPRKYLLQNLQKLGKKLIGSETDSMDINTLTEPQIKAVSDPSKFLTQPISVNDVPVDQFKLYNCYTEIFRNQNIINIERENKRVLSAILEES